jgi:hypothetical protein
VTDAEISASLLSLKATYLSEKKTVSAAMICATVVVEKMKISAMIEMAKPE